MVERREGLLGNGKEMGRLTGDRGLLELSLLVIRLGREELESRRRACTEWEGSGRQTIRHPRFERTRCRRFGAMGRWNR